MKILGCARNLLDQTIPAINIKPCAAVENWKYEKGGMMEAVSQVYLASSEGGVAPTGDNPSFDWQNVWYPAAFLRDLPKDKPTRISLYDQPFVLFFDDTGRVNCLQDRCPHRAARLSDGQMVNGRLECLYHGWQFGAAGRCLLIPQLYPDKDIPERSHVRAYSTAIRHEIVWFWAGDAALADETLIPGTNQDETADIYSVTFQMDLPYDQSYLVENVIDIAHIHIAHHGVRGGGHREAAKPLEFRIDESNVSGIKATFRSVGLERAKDSPALGGALVEFVAPNLVRFASKYQDPSLVAGLDLFSLPMGKNKCRLLYRKYSNFTSLRERIKPRWLEHLTQCKILEQDMAVVVGQHAQIEQNDIPLRDLWLPLKTSDRLVVEYRKWLDHFGSGMPFHRGFATARNSGHDHAKQDLPCDRHVLHTQICATCGRLHQTLGRVITVLWGIIAVTGIIGLTLDGQADRVIAGIVLATALLANGAAFKLRAWL